MVLYLIRHGKDDDSIRGGWSRHPLTEEGRREAIQLGESIKRQQDSYKISQIFSSDLPRAMETAAEISNQLNLPIQLMPEFREVNNGELAGMKNEIAAERYPDFYWNIMDWTQAYPNGESPEEFYKRISEHWSKFAYKLSTQNKNCILVTHGGVLQVILCLIHGISYNNKAPMRKIKPCEIIALEYDHGTWNEII